MKKKIAAILLSGIMAMGMIVPGTVMAETTDSGTTSEEDPIAGLLGGLLGGSEEGGGLSEALGKLTGEGGALSEALGKLTEEGSGLSEALGKLTGEDGALSGILDGLTGEGGALSKLTEKGGPVDQLFGEGGALSELLPEGTDVNEIIQGIGSRLSDKNSDLFQAAEGLFSKIAGGSGEDLDINALGQLTEGLFGSDDDMMDDEELNELRDDFARREAIAEYIQAENKGTLEAGDIEISDPFVVKDKDTADGRLMLAYALQVNYTIEGDTATEVASKEFPALYTVVKDENGEFAVKDAVYAEEGDSYDADLADFCGQVDVSVDEFAETVALGKVSVVYELLEALADYPDVKFVNNADGKVSLEELEAQADEAMSAVVSLMLAAEDTAADTADAAADAAEAVTDAAAEAVAEVETQVAEAAAE